jgi:hypothetical protein
MRRPLIRFFWVVLVVVLANYAAQVPYAAHLRKSPSISGSLLLGATFAWFLIGYVGLLHGARLGYWILLSFLLTEVGFYAYNLINQTRHGYPPFMHLQERDPILFVVFAIGYVNMLAGAAFILYLLRQRRALLRADRGHRMHLR